MCKMPFQALFWAIMRIQDIERERFTKHLLEWNDGANSRKMPWKGEKDPYKIWLSEVILQQTRVEQGLAYYNSFVKKYPTVTHLARAVDSEVFKLWEGLGYYSRCRNLIATARIIVEKFDGLFPDNYNDLLQLKGIGPYTASAIASFAFNLPHAVVDGNVTRVLARYFGITDPVNDAAVKSKFADLAQSLLDKKRPASYNQAIMDFGATVCKPQKPECNNCPLRMDCTANLSDKVTSLPVKIKAAPRKKRFFTYLILAHACHVWVRERTDRDVWRHLWEFYLMEGKNGNALTQRSIDALISENLWQVGRIHFFDRNIRQLLTHQEIHSNYILLELLSKPTFTCKGKWLSALQVDELAFPKTINTFLQDEGGLEAIFSLIAD
jgi:A/G-specific adenine glycosylase